MRFSQHSMIALISSASFLSTSSNAFSVNPLPTTSSSSSLKSSRMDQGWNNDNFLDALGSPDSNALEEANEKYHRESSGRASIRERRFQAAYGETSDSASAGANVPADPVVPVANVGNNVGDDAMMMGDSNPMGGERFQRMMQEAQSRGDGGAIRNFAPPQQQPVQPQQQQQSIDDPQVYYQMQVQWQEAMAMYTKFCAENPQAAASMSPPPPPPPPNFIDPIQQQQTAPPPVQPIAPPQVPEQPQQQQYAPPTPPPPQPTGGVKEKEGIILESDNPRDYLPKPVEGRNTDSYEVTNPADIYFAQLKRDSQVRNLARKEGDIEKANQPFAEKGVQALRHVIDPALMDQRRKTFEETGGEFMTSQDEMILPYADDGDEVVDKASTGVSYKDKLAEMKRKRAAKNGE